MKTKAKVLIAGGTGLIGTKLAKLLSESGYQVSILSRSKGLNSEYEHFVWDPSLNNIQEKTLEGIDCLINLAGTSIAEARWTKKQKGKILESRINATNLLFESTRKLKKKPPIYIAASAVGYYGSKTSEHIYKEEDPNGTDFLAQVCKKWEMASSKFNDLEVRTVILRTGVVFDKNLGAFPKMMQTLKYGFVSGVGSGNQYIPWIHIDDLLMIYLHAIENLNIKGTYNAVSPESLTQNELNQHIKKISKKIKLPNLPGILIKTVFGEMASILLNGSRISSQKIIDTGFVFKHQSIQTALKNLV